MSEEAFDRSELVQHCQRQYGWSNDIALLLVNEFIDRFFALKREAADELATRISPSGMIDQVWHVALLYTQEYAAHCEHAVGFFVHHRPQGEFEIEARDQRYFDTLKLYSHLYGKPDELLWPTFPLDVTKESDWLRKLISKPSPRPKRTATATPSNSATKASKSSAKKSRSRRKAEVEEEESEESE